MAVIRPSLGGIRKLRMDKTSAVGPASYDSSARPTMTVPYLRQINGLESIKLWADGYIVEPVSVAGNVVTYRVRWSPAHAHTFSGDALASHQHDVTTVNAAGGGSAMTAPSTPGPLEDAGGGQVNTGAVDAASAGTPAGTNANQALAVNAEVTDTTNLSGVTVYCEAEGW